MSKNVSKKVKQARQEEVDWMGDALCGFLNDAIKKFVKGRKDHDWQPLENVNCKAEIEQEMQDLIIYWIMLNYARKNK